MNDDGSARGPVTGSVSGIVEWAGAAQDDHDDEAPPSSSYPSLVMLVDVPDAMLELCRNAASPMPVLRVDGGRRALQRIVGLRPIVIMVGPEADAETVHAVRSRAVVVRSAVVLLSERAERPLEDEVRVAIANAEVARAVARARSSSNIA